MAVELEGRARAETTLAYIDSGEYQIILPENIGIVGWTG
jgi:hypothetical protein